MLPSITNSLAYLAGAGAADAAQAAANAGTGAVRAAVADAIVGVAVGSAAGALGGVAASAAAKTSKATKSSSSSSGAGYAQGAATPKASTSKSSSTEKTSSALAFLDDKRLSIEEKLVRLLAYLNGKWDKDLEAKMKELKGADASAKASGGSTSSATSKSTKSSGVLGSIGAIVNVAKQFFPQVGIALSVLQSPLAREVLSKVGGPVLAAAATAAGFPQLAPVALRYGPALIDAAAGLATSIGNEAASAAVASTVAPASSGAVSGSSTGASSGSAGSAPGDGALSSDRDAQLKLMEIQWIMDQQKEMFSLVSNLLRTGHDTRMAVIQNVR